MNLFNARNKSRVIAIIAFVGLLAVFLLGLYYMRHKKANVEKSYTLYIYDETTYDQLLDSLESSGCLKNLKTFEYVAKKMLLPDNLKPGKYQISKGMSNQYIIRSIIKKWEKPTRLVLSGNIRDTRKLAYILSRQLEADSSEFYSVLSDKNLIDSLGFNEFDFIGMFIPNTYEVYWSDSPKEIILRMHKEYTKFWNAQRISKAEKLKLSPSEVGTLASIVASESNYKKELPIIAGVYLNRLKKNMKLQADPTVRYIAIVDEPDLRRILKKHLRMESPYNTYIHKGLPPGPICMPSIAAIDAVLNPTRHDYLYFCAEENLDGTHAFASNYVEHLVNARKYQRAISELQKKSKD